MSINDCLLTGPNLIPKLFDVVIRFCWNNIAITADIEKAFLMISINCSDRNLLRFLWLKEPGNVNSEVCHFRFNRLVFGLLPSPAVLGSVISHHLSKYSKQYTTLVQSIADSLYVDDLIAGADSVEQGFYLYKKSKEIMADASFNLRKWNSSCRELLDQIKEAELQSLNQVSSTGVNTPSSDTLLNGTVIDLGKACTESEVSKLLGVAWSSQTDEFLFCFSDLIEYAQGLPVTKRSLLKVTARIFDPLGLISPFIIKLKVLFQALCAESVKWDEPLQDKALEQWNCFVSEARAFSQLSVPRCYFLSNTVPTQVELHGLSDASEQAFVAAIYLRAIYRDGSITTRLVTSKARVAPMKKQSIPRLELLGALILSRLANTVMKSMARNIVTFYWVDSMTTLFWIRREKQWKQYVANRVKEIRQLTSRDLWRHCPRHLNPADLASRGVSGDRLLNNSLWWEGPPFLLLTEDEWPCKVEPYDNDSVACQELVKNPSELTHVLAVNSKSTPNLEAIIDCSRYSSLTCLLRVTALVFQFVRRFRQLNLDGPVSPNIQLVAEDLQYAELSWVCHIQAKSFVKEFEYLRSPGNQPAPTYVQQFGLFLDDNNVMKCKGRINNSTVSLEEKNPIFLPAKHPLIKLLVMHIHQQAKHGGVNITLTTLRERYWILKGRQIVKSILRSCVVCKKLEGLPYASPCPPDLPACRVSDDLPFAHTGLDFAGPLYVQESTDRGNDTKVYMRLFTCASTRAIHLELTRGLNVDSFLLAFRRFVGRRGLPATLLSDNATTFRSSSKEIQSICRSSEVFHYLTNNRTSWKFIVPKAPWWGGFWERMVQTVKCSLRKVVGRAILRFDELNTLLIEIESIING